jgi:glutamate-1-semialdehyde 2,1-aminomutase
MTSNIFQRYIDKTPGSAALHRRAADLFPSGITHDGRYMQPHPLFVARAAGGRKWDVDGNEYVDFFGGHGSLLLGHCHPAVVEAVTAQAARGSHYGASHALEVEWAEMVRQMVPCAERVRFTASGTEATLLGLRLARIYTGKPRFLRFSAHFHGWHDAVVFGGPAAVSDAPAGVAAEVVSSAVVCPPGDAAALRALVEANDSVGALILEPTGASFGHVPLPGQFLKEVREIARQHGIVLIFDEVISGFRCAPGGAQEFYGVTPDLATFAKVLAGGYPGGALAGRAEIFAAMQFGSQDGRVLPPPLSHQGTFNANPVSAAAGIATLKLVRSTGIIDCANRGAAILREGMNERLRRRGSPWCAYGDFSGFHVFTNPARENIGPEEIQAGRVSWKTLKAATPAPLMHKIRAALLCGGIDVCTWPGGWVSGVHSDADIERALAAFDTALDLLREEG